MLGLFDFADDRYRVDPLPLVVVGDRRADRLLGKYRTVDLYRGKSVKAS
jgi:hypothetical protein